MATDIAVDDRALAVEGRVEALLAQMTLEQKVHILHGHVQMAYTVPPIPEIGFPGLRMTDGPAGANVTEARACSTALPAPLAVAATWNPELASMQGDVIAQELLANGMNVLLAPNTDIVRQPWWGRAAEQWGEDPLLAAGMAVAFVRAVQAHPVVATVKHFLLYNQETNRLAGANSVADERALREVYLPPFVAALRAGNAGAVMSSFNNVNGVPACESKELLLDLLKGELGFRGWVMSDYGSTTSTVAAANAGFDQEMPGGAGGGYGGGGPSFFGDSLLEAVRGGQVSAARLDDMVRRILRPMFALGLFDVTAIRGATPVDEHSAKAHQIAAEAITLLKNEDELLPLSGEFVRSIALIGADTGHRIAAGGASYVSTSGHATTLLDGLTARAGRLGIEVRHVAGTDLVGPTSMLPGPAAVPSSVLTSPDAAPGVHGLRAEYWLNTTFFGQPVLVRTDPQVNLSLGFLSQVFNASAVPPPPGVSGDLVSARWTGAFTAPKTGEYTLALTSLGSARLWFDEQLIIDASEPHRLRVDASAVLHLVAGEPHALKVEYASTTRSDGLELGDVQLGWTHPVGAVPAAMQDAASLAAGADVAVVLARAYESEQRDRASLTLPNEQDALIQAVAEANPRTVVVLGCGGPVTMPWIDNVQAVLNAYYAGQEQGAAIAGILFGDVNPSGKLPITFPASESQVPVANPAQHAHEKNVVYTEGVFVGYRAYDQYGLDPLFPFGHGLSYTTFAYSNLRLSSDVLAPAGSIDVSVDVTNTGRRSGQEVVQLYVRDVEAGVARPPKELKDFAKIGLAPGETRTVRLAIDSKSLAYWDEAQHGWVAEAGAFEVLIGSSSRDIRLRAEFQLTDGERFR
jgi:beta-glucosidase